MKKFNSEEMLAVNILAGIAGLILGFAISTPTSNSKHKKMLNPDLIEIEQQLDEGVWMVHAYYTDADYEYEVSERTVEGALRTLHELVTA